MLEEILFARETRTNGLNVCPEVKFVWVDCQTVVKKTRRPLNYYLLYNNVFFFLRNAEKRKWKNTILAHFRK